VKSVTPKESYQSSGYNLGGSFSVYVNAILGVIEQQRAVGSW